MGKHRGGGKGTHAIRSFGRDWNKTTHVYFGGEAEDEKVAKDLHFVRHDKRDSGGMLENCEIFMSGRTIPNANIGSYIYRCR